MNKLKLLEILLFGTVLVFSVFTISVRAAGEESVWYRCRSASFGPDDTSLAWNKRGNESKCETNIEANDAYIYLQYGTGTNSPPARKTAIYPVKIRYQEAAVVATATPAPTSAGGGATATPAPTAAAGGATVTPTPTPTPADAKASSTNRCPNLGADTPLDVVQDCKLNVMDGAKILKGIREHSGQ